jgi:hypothetical protein
MMLSDQYRPIEIALTREYDPLNRGEMGHIIIIDEGGVGLFFSC